MCDGLVIVIIFMPFRQAGAKRCGEHFKVINWGGIACKKRGNLFKGKKSSHYVKLVY